MLLTSLQTTYWDRANQLRWGRYLSSLEERTVQHALGLFRAPGTVADIGCGSGRWSAMAAAAGWQTLCMDVDHEALAICRDRVPYGSHHHLDPHWTSLPIRDGSVNAIFCIEVFEVMGKALLTTEVDRVLAPGGLFVGVFENRLSWRGLLAQFRLAGSMRRSSYSKTYGAWRKEMKRRGFSFLHEQGVGWAPFNRASDSPLIPVATHLERCFGLRHCQRFSPWIIFIARKV